MFHVELKPVGATGRPQQHFNCVVLALKAKEFKFFSALAPAIHLQCIIGETWGNPTGIVNFSGRPVPGDTSNVVQNVDEIQI